MKLICLTSKTFCIVDFAVIYPTSTNIGRQYFTNIIVGILQHFRLLIWSTIVLLL